MQCLYCGKQLPLFKKLTGGGEFCSDAHREKYHEEYNRLALSRLLQAQSKPEDIKVDPKRHGGSIPEPSRGRRPNRAAQEPPAAVPKPETIAAPPAIAESPAVSQKGMPAATEPRPAPEQPVVVETIEEAVAPADAAGFLPQIGGIDALALRRNEAPAAAEAGAVALECTPSPVLPQTEDPVVAGGSLPWGEPLTSLHLSSRWQQPAPRECDLATREYGQTKATLDFDLANLQIGAIGAPKSVPLRIDCWPPEHSGRFVMLAPLPFQIAAEPPVVNLSGLELVGEGFTQSEKRAETPAQADAVQSSAASPEPERVPENMSAGVALNGVVETSMDPADMQPAKKNGKRSGNKGRKKANGSAPQAGEAAAQEPGVPGPHSIRPVRIPPMPLQLPPLAAGFDCMTVSINPRLLRYSTLPLRPKMAVGTVSNPSTGRDGASALHEGSEVGAWAPEFTPVETGGLLSKLGGLLRKR